RIENKSQEQLLPIVVPLARLERARLSTNDFESFASTIPPQGPARVARLSRARPRHQGAASGPLERAGEKLVEPRMGRIVAGQDLLVADRLRHPAEVGDEAPSLAHQQTARSRIPRLEPAFPKALVAPCRD